MNNLPIVLTELRNEKTHIKFKVPLSLLPEISKSGIIKVEDNLLSIYVFSFNRKQLIKELEEQVLMLWEEYALIDEKDLSGYSKEVKRNLLEAIVKL